MKRLLVLVSVFALCFMCNAQQLTGKMTYNWWSGKISIGGETIPKGDERAYFSPDDYQTFREGCLYRSPGVGLMVCGGACILRSIISTNGDIVHVPHANNPWLLTGIGLGIVGYIVDTRAIAKIRHAVDNYNKAQTSGLTIASTQNGVGLVYRF